MKRLCGRIKAHPRLENAFVAIYFASFEQHAFERLASANQGERQRCDADPLGKRLAFNRRERPAEH